MNIVFSFAYAPFVFLSLKYFEIQTVSLIIFTSSLLWFILSIKKDKNALLFPLFYMGVSSVCFFAENFMVLKSLPLLISMLVGIYLFYSYLTKNSVIISFAKRFKEISLKEERYIQNSTILWVFASLVNILIHGFVLLDDNMDYWVIYSTFGWYFVFITAFIIQMVHRKIFFKETV